MTRILAILTILLTVACQSGQPEVALAKEGTYYINMSSYCSDLTANKRKAAIQDKLIQKKYAITHQAGLSWPFFESYHLDESIPKEDLMPPHTLSHTFKMIEEVEQFKENDARLNITLKCSEGIYSFDMVTYHFRNGQWNKTVDTGNHIIPRNKYSNEEELTAVLFQSIVRYSFK